MFALFFPWHGRVDSRVEGRGYRLVLQMNILFF